MQKKWLMRFIIGIILCIFMFPSSVYAVQIKNNTKEDLVYLQTNDTITSKAGKIYLFRRVDKMLNYDNKNAMYGSWDVSAYEGDKNKGVIIESTDKSQVLKLPVKLNGWFKVCVGYASGTTAFIIRRTENKDSYVFRKKNNSYDNLEGKQFICEKNMSVCNFKEDSVEIVPCNFGKARIAYIKLIGLTRKEIKEYNKLDEGKKGNRIIYDFDGYSDFFSGNYPNGNDLKMRTVGVLSEKGVGEINWCLGTTCMLNYNSRYAGEAFEYDKKYDYQFRDGDRIARKQILNIIKSGKSPLEIIADEGEKAGMKVNASLRMNAFYNPEKYGFLNGMMYDEYKNCLQKGSQAISYKYPKFRTYIKNVLKEAASFKNVDGVTLDFCRYPTVMGQEAEQKEKIAIMNQFMNELRNEMPKNKTITVRIPYKNPLFYGFDIKTWVKKGYIDRLIPSNISNEDFFDITPYVKMVRGTKVKLYIGIVADVKGHDLTKKEEILMKMGLYVHKKEYLNIDQYLLRTYDVYKKGADGIFLFNTTSNILIDSTSPVEGKYLGDKIKMQKWYKLQYYNGKPPKQEEVTIYKF
ncbi:hypothetical protein OW763_01940 [Clostridium aestuarii]|uniref:Glycosyl hydrolase-like 10 domain-containing protein n=1 Tax=Clostridium aestuarii TaxID=338193 RepID=A0ABT4CYS0_9CLOT|nr:hypothetical protein [Clostridium aestuarii]MCY6483115.1 hypothetical protein [Clostridium aestuarii]